MTEQFTVEACCLPALWVSLQCLLVEFLSPVHVAAPFSANSKIYQSRVGPASSLAYLPNNLALAWVLDISCLIPFGKGSSDGLLNSRVFGDLSEYKSTRHGKKSICVVIPVGVEQPLNKRIIDEAIKGVAKRVHL